MTRDRKGYLNVQIRSEEAKQRWRDLEEEVAQALGVPRDELSREDIAREAAEAYTGGEACGRWRQ